MSDSSNEHIATLAFIDRLKEVTMEYEVKPILKELNKIAKDVGKKEKIKTLEIDVIEKVIVGDIADKVAQKLMKTYGVYVEQYIKNTPYITLRKYQMLDLFLFDIVAPYKLEHQAFFEYPRIRHTLVAHFHPYALITLERTFPTEFPEYILKIKDNPEQLKKMAALYEVLDELITYYDVRKKKSSLKILFEQEPYKLNLKQIGTLLDIMYYMRKTSPKEIREVIHDLLIGF